MRRLCLLVLLALLLGGIGAAVPVSAQDQDPASAARAALAWLRARQQDDGSFPGFDAGASADAIFALAAAGVDPSAALRRSPLTYLAGQAASYAAKSTAAAGKLALAVEAAGQRPDSFGGQDLIAQIERAYAAGTGRYGAQITDHVYALLALAGAAGRPIPPGSIAALRASQLPDGGWSFDGSSATGSDTNTTALAIQALAAAGARGDALSKALAYLKSQQNSDGGFGYAQRAASDANSTAAAIQALAAAGVDPRGWAQDGGDPISALLALQNDSGAFRYQASPPDDNDLATAQAIPALLLRPLPILPATPGARQRLPRTGGDASAPVLLAPVLLALLLLLIGAAMRMRRWRRDA